MANIKEGHEYFYYECAVNRDSKVRKVLREHGPTASAVLTELWCAIYSDKGYYLKWDEDSVPCDIADNLYEKDIDKVRIIILSFVSSGVFDERLFREESVLTSRGVQRRYLEVAKAKKRATSINEEYNLLAEDETTEDVSDKTDEKDVKLPEDSGKFSKLPEDSGKFWKVPENSGLKKRKERKERNKLIPPNPPLGELGEEKILDEAVLEGDYPHREIVEAWNEVFPGPVQSEPRHVPAPPDGLNALFWENARQAESEGFTQTDFKRAFKALRDDPSRDWQIHSAVKPSNMRILLTRWKNTLNNRDGPKNARSKTNEPYGKDKPGYGKRGYYT